MHILGAVNRLLFVEGVAFALLIGNENIFYTRRKNNKKDFRSLSTTVPDSYVPITSAIFSTPLASH
jgi:hypothetical protein